MALSWRVMTASRHSQDRNFIPQVRHEIGINGERHQRAVFNDQVPRRLTGDLGPVFHLQPAPHGPMAAPTSQNAAEPTSPGT